MKKIHIKSFLLFLLFALNSCQLNDKCLEFETKTMRLSIDKYLYTFKYGKVNSKTQKQFVFVSSNNPCHFDKNDGMLIFANNKCVWKGKYNRNCLMSSNLIEENRPINLVVQVVSQIKSNRIKIFHFQNKDVFTLDSTISCIYMDILPTNENTDRVKFYLQKKCF